MHANALCITFVHFRDVSLVHACALCFTHWDGAPGCIGRAYPLGFYLQQLPMG